MPTPKQKTAAQVTEAEKAAALKAANDAAAKQAEGPKGPTIDITAPRSYRRAGMRFGPKPVTLDPAELDEETVKILKKDPVLIIRPTPEPEE